MTNAEASDYIEELLREFPQVPTMTLAKKAYKEHGNSFKSLESVRSRIRYRRGNIGERQMGKATARHKDTFRSKGKAGWKVELPQSVVKANRNVNLPNGKIAVLSDIHVPYHDDDALNACLEYLDYWQPSCIYLNGDTADFYTISRWEKDPEERNFPREIQLVKDFLAHLNERYPNAEKFYKIGNHEERYEKYLANKAPELFGVTEFRINKILGLDNMGYRLVRSKQKAKAGKNLTIIHGHEIYGCNVPVNFARTLQTKMGVCTVAGHRHATSEHSYKTAENQFVHCFATGCLCDLTPDYAIVNNWNHGFLTIELDGNRFQCDNKRIVDGEVF